MTKQEEKELRSELCKMDDAIQAAHNATRNYYYNLIYDADHEMSPAEWQMGYCIYEKVGNARWCKFCGTGKFFGYDIRSEVGARIAG